ncbi:imm11 family protein [Marinigracilibium pacificum]|uniref:Immunity MXAN-0049 protein domain-containing protein n=1 Tax=Marinigracilibium pacificum TaxID=2729599 RepID=A0A848J4B3_9BACT|nr:DUF1629 domain-containing protein [Marinigracilibium pacificum]NMM49189.1 hypothetical protein [Marinigracilibium pacificum]
MELKYYEIEPSVDLDIVGTIPQISNTKNGLKKADLDTYKKIKKAKSFPEKIPGLDNLILDTGAKLTDFLDCTFLAGLRGILVSLRMKKVLDGLKISAGKFYDVNLHYNGKVYEYYFLYFLESIDLVNYPKSIFVVADYLDMDEENEIKLNSYEMHGLENKKVEAGYIVNNKVISLKFMPDLFALPYSNIIYLSEVTKKNLEAANLTGFDINSTKTVFYK